MKNKIQSFFWGIFTAGVALFLELILASFFKVDYLDTANIIFVIIMIASVIIEEVTKYIVILKKIIFLSFGRNAIINAWIAGVGFYLVEIFIFYQKALMENLDFNQIDLFKIGLLHILTFGIFGYRIAIKKDNKLDVGIVAIVVSLHFTYNISSQYMGEATYFVINLVLIALVAYNIFGFFVVNKKLAHN